MPALFSVSSGHVLRHEAFCWDALARELDRQGAPRHVLDTELRRLKLLTPPQLEAAMRLRFGPDVLPSTQLTKMQPRYLPSSLIKSWRSSAYWTAS